MTESSAASPAPEPSDRARAPSNARAPVAITGANRGVGLATAQEVSRAGHPVVLLCRSADRGRRAAETLAPPNGPWPHEVVPIDLASLDSVRQAGAAVAEMGRPLAALVNNAAVLPAERTESADGFELQLAVNHLAHFLLTCLLMPLLQRSPGVDQRSPGVARVITVSSGAHYGPAFDFDDPNFARKRYGPREAYQQSKLANVLFANALARRSGAVQSLALGPGVYDTALLKDYLGGGPTSSAPFPVADSADAGPILADLAIDRPDENLNGGYFDRGARVAPSPAALDERDQERLWDWSASATDAPEV